MNIKSLFIFLIIMILILIADTLSCKAGRGGCIASCMVQNCATGYCEDNNICKCVRCVNGPYKPW